MDPIEISKSPSHLLSPGLTPFGLRSWFPCPSWWLCCWVDEGTCEARDTRAPRLLCPFQSGKRMGPSAVVNLQWELLFWPFCYPWPFSRTLRTWSIDHSSTLYDLFCLTELRKWDSSSTNTWEGFTWGRNLGGPWFQFWLTALQHVLSRF